ncbi:hypothetical protein FANTH_9471 [Fusarium anthophilum]|uniref:Aldehyde dehydrogenase domain-containing protein n=1 Tax=Fusarium anthophilum TaxID=48485 RepID=A0A8H5DYW1_9HYPO|nr:hypothetical protein FANTH_9471 [Fusarium anthophilum]
MTSRINTTIAQVRSTAIEGRMRDLRHRQEQLLSLHKHLRENESEVIKASRADDGLTADEALFVLGSTLSEIRTHYDALDLKKELKVEYGIKWGRSNVNKRAAHSLAYIILDKQSLLFNVLSAFAAATEAGACCIFNIENGRPLTLALLNKFFRMLHDKDAVCITMSQPSVDLLQNCLVVDQVGSNTIAAGLAHPDRYLRSSPQSLNVAVVDRTANIQEAATGLVRSRIAFGASSRQAVDHVFVNEFVMEDFLNAVAKAIETWPNRKVDDLKSNKAKTVPGYANISTEPSICSVLRPETARSNKNSRFMAKKVEDRVLVVDIMTSLDDAIDTVLEGSVDLGALYIFAGLKEAKYISQHIPTRVTFVNHVPRRFQVGPSPPVGYAVTNTIRYTRQMFEMNSSQFVQDKSKGRAAEETAALLEQERHPLRPTGQAKAGAVGFFDVGVMLGAAVYLMPPFIACVFGVGYWLHKAWRAVSN